MERERWRGRKREKEMERETTCPSEVSLSNGMNGLEIGANQDQGADIKR